MVVKDWPGIVTVTSGP
jgi:hypothetical protein